MIHLTSFFILFILLVYTDSEFCQIQFQTNCWCGNINNQCDSNKDEKCNLLNTKWIKPCNTFNNLAPIQGCYCDGNVCLENQICKDGLCFSPCTNNAIISDNQCFCGENGNVCLENQICQDGDCLSPCTNNAVSDNPCFCHENSNVCLQGQMCKDGDCLSPPPSPVSAIFLIIGLFFGLTLMFIFFLLLNLLIK